MPDYNVVNPPAGVSYAPPNMAQSLYNMIGDLPEAYYRGQAAEAIRQQAQPVMGPNGPEMDPQKIMAAQFAKPGGGAAQTNYAQQLFPFYLKSMADKSAVPVLGGNEPEGPPARRFPNVPNATSPSQIRGAQQTNNTAPVAQEGEGESVRTLMAGLFPDANFSEKTLTNYASAIGVKNPNQPLTDAQQARLRQVARSNGPSAASKPLNMSGRENADEHTTAAATAETPSTRISGAFASIGAGPLMRPATQGGVSGGPGPGPTPANVQEQTSLSSGIAPHGLPSSPTAEGAIQRAGSSTAQAPQRVAQAAPRGDPTYGGLIPRTWLQSHPGGTLGDYRDDLASTLAGRWAPMMSDSTKNALTNRLKTVDSLMEKNSEKTTEQKNAEASGFSDPAEYDRVKRIRDIAIERSNKAYSGLQGQEDQYKKETRPLLQMSRTILSDPRMWTGSGANFSFEWNKIKAIYGDGAPAMLQGALQKMTAASMLSVINQQKLQMDAAGENAGRIFAQQIEMTRKASPQLEGTLGSNRFLVELQIRTGERNAEIAKMARKYLADPNGPGYLDHKFDDNAADWLDAHPIFSTQELSHAELLGAPTVPPDKVGDNNRIAQWGKDLGMQPGDPIRNEKGEYKRLPKLTVRPASGGY